MSDEVAVEATPEVSVEQSAEPTVETQAAPDWYESFKSSLSDSERKSIEKYKDGESFKNGTFSAFSMIGKKGDIPQENATDEQKAEFWNKLGADKLEVSAPEFGEEFGDLGAKLSEYYGGITQDILDIAKEIIPKSGNVNEMLSGILNEYIQRDANAAREAEIAQKAQMKEDFNKAAVAAGMTPDQFRATNEEVMKRFGWDENTHIGTILNALGAATSNSNEIKDARMHNTSEGLRSRTVF